MAIVHDTTTQEPMSSKFSPEIATMELKESDIVTQEPVLLKIFVETAVQTETVETHEMAVQTEAEIGETHEVAVYTEEHEEMDHIL